MRKAYVAIAVLAVIAVVEFGIIAGPYVLDWVTGPISGPELYPYPFVTSLSMNETMKVNESVDIVFSIRLCDEWLRYYDSCAGNMQLTINASSDRFIIFGNSNGDNPFFVVDDEPRELKWSARPLVNGTFTITLSYHYEVFLKDDHGWTGTTDEGILQANVVVVR